MARFISKDDINKEVRKCLHIQKKALPHHQNLPANSDERKYYVDSREISFVFEKEMVLQLLNRPGTKYLRVYYGALHMDDPKHPTNPNFKKGRPTVILMAAKDGSFINLLDPTGGGDDGLQWPEGLPPKGDDTSFDASDDPGY